MYIGERKSFPQMKEEEKMKKTIFKRLIALGLMITMVISAAGCGASNNSETETKTTKESDAVTNNTVSGTEDEQSDEVVPGWQLNAEEDVTLSWYINFSWFTTAWGESLVSKAITEETGINIDFIVPAGNEAEKLNSLIASDSLPDIITLERSTSQIGDLIEDDMVYALDELAEEYDMYWFEVANTERVAWYTREDGHIYEYPNASFSASDYEENDNISATQTFLVRKDIYEAIGSPDMTTQEGFKAAVKAAAEQFPEVNGQSLIPVGLHEFATTGNMSFNILPLFLAIPFEKDGKAYDEYTDPEFVSWLKLFRELGEEGYLADDIFIDKRAQMEEKIAQGRYFCMIYQRTDMATQQKILYQNDPDSIYMAVDGPKNSNGDDHTLSGLGIRGWTVTMISKNCKYPDRAIQLMSYFMSEHGQHMITLGVEGETWDYVDGVPTMREEIRELANTDRSAFDKQYGADAAYWMLHDSAMGLQWAVPPTEPLAQMEEWTYPYVINASQYEVVLATGSEEADIKSKVDNEWGVVLPKLLLAGSEEEFDTIWNEFLQKRQDWGYDKVLEAKTELMNKAKEKLGIE